eukprot:TRINITY_DN363_c0_g3_i10.p1 TRINITY_DN363_c0_g3~~TRINITY_DN363_c0_g3_i10.p1  ORF type:complete len:124 (-),score=22.25 TRINITY_DN363_c0_g3_i10:125-496(-)
MHSTCWVVWIQKVVIPLIQNLPYSFLGRGAVYNYDAVGSFERTSYSASGSGQSLLIPLLDNQIGRGNQPNTPVVSLSLEQALCLIKDGLTSAGERDIYTGDFVDIAIITKDGVKYEKFELKQD